MGMAHVKRKTIEVPKSSLINLGHGIVDRHVGGQFTPTSCEVHTQGHISKQC